MKLKYLTTAMAFPLISMTLANDEAIVSPFERLGADLIEALKSNSQQKFEEQFPTLSYFHQLMDENAALYGENLRDAKIDFARTYINELVPQLRESFQLMIQEGNKNGIDWEKIRFKRAAFVGKRARRPGSSPFDVTFDCGDREFTLHFDRVIMNGKRWYIGTQAKLI